MSITLLAMAYQDLKERHIYAFLLGLFALFAGGLHVVNSNLDSFGWIAVINIVLVSILLGILWGYSRFKLKKSMSRETFGLGDTLLLYGFALGFPTYTFVILLVSSLVFSLVLSLFPLLGSSHRTIPLAGYISIFLGTIYMISWFTPNINLYRI